MASWRDGASETAVADIDGLFNEAPGFALLQLRKHGEFFPYGRTVSLSGEMRATAADPGLGEHPPSQAVIDTLVDAYRSGRDELRATAIVIDVLLSGRDAVLVRLEHREG